MMISFIIPCYKSEHTLENVVDGIENMMSTRSDFESEIVLVNDGSPDNTFATIRKLADKYANITGIDFAKNRGQQSAIMAAIKYSKGEIVACCDDDGQTPIDTVFQFIEKMETEGYDVVCANYVNRGKRSLFRRFGSWLNDQMSIYFLDKPKDVNTSVYFVAKRFVAEEMAKYDNPYPYITGLLLRTTGRIGNVDVEQKSRLAGQSGYNFKRLLSLWVNGITTFSIKPLRLANIIGCLLALIGFVIIIALVIEKLLNPHVSLGWTSIIATNLLVGGIIMMILGVIGEYIGRIYICLNKTPQYVERTVIGRNSGDNE